LSNGIVPLLLGLCWITSYILGMGLPIVAAYLVLIVLAAPALQILGIPLFTAHLVILWYSQDSTITPPVCPNVFVAMGIAGVPGKELWKTGFRAVRFSLGLYYIPFFFVYNPGILLKGSVADVFVATISAVGLVLAFTVGVEGYFFTRLRLIERISFLLSGICLLIPTAYIKAMGGILLFLATIAQTINKKQELEVVKA